MVQLKDQYKSTIHELVQRMLDLERWRRNVTGNSPLFDIANEHTPDTLGGDQNDYDPGFYDVLRLNTTQDISVTGISRGQKGRFLELQNISSFNITLPYESTSSAAANRIINSSGVDIRLFPTGRVRMYYDSTTARWVISDPPSWRGTYGISTRLYLSSVNSLQTIPDNVTTQILFDTIDATVGDPWGLFDAANNRIVIPTGLGGLYTGVLSGTWVDCATGATMELLYTSTGKVFTPGIDIPSLINHPINISLPVTLVCAPGDVIEFHALQDSGGPLDLFNIELHFGRIG